MNGGAAPSAWPFYRFALFVTGDGERAFLPSLFRPLERGGHCHFRVVHQISQRRPIHSRARKQEMVGRGKLIPDKDEEIGLKARKYLQEGYNFVVLIDDLEEIEHGRAIVGNLDVAKVLSQRETCRSLRTAFAWCNRAMGLPPTELFRLADGQLSPFTSEQLDRLPPPVVDHPSRDVPRRESTS
jgi:hypothetical protein